MSTTNRVSATLSEADKQAVLDAIATIKTKLPFLVGLPKDARGELPRLGEKTVGYDADCRAAMAARPDLIPSFVQMDELAKDRALWGPLGEIAAALEPVAGAVRDTFDVVGSEIYDADRAFHASVREAAKRGVPGAQAIYDQLKLRFPGRARGNSGVAAA